MWFSTPEYNEIKVPKVETNAGYTVGVSNDGKTMLNITSRYTTISLTMGEYDTRRLIRLLEATLPVQETE